MLSNYSKRTFPNNGWEDAFPSNVIGWTYPPNTTRYIKYKFIEKNLAMVVFRVDGTSNSTTTSFTLPFSFLSPSITGETIVVPITVANNNTSIWGQLTITKDPRTGGMLCTGTQGTNAGWTASGTKQFRGMFFVPVQA
jgi:hypothetical protein